MIKIHTMHIVIGPSHSGKSSYIKKYCSKKDRIISADKLKLKLFNKYNLSSEDEDLLWRKINYSIKLTMNNNKKDIWLDATNRNINERMVYYKLSKKYHYKQECHMFLYPIFELLSRNRADSKSTIDDLFIVKQLLTLDIPELGKDCDKISFITSNDIKLPNNIDEFYNDFLYPYSYNSFSLNERLKKYINFSYYMINSNK